MWTNIGDLQDFYRAPLGRMARRMIRQRLHGLWPDTKDMTLLGVGYATPYLTPFLPDAHRVLAVMPPAQGAVRWPHLTGKHQSGRPRPSLTRASRTCASLTCVSAENHLPFPDLSIDRALLVHAVEHSEVLRLFLREIWRVLRDDGRLIVVTPSRRGLWSRSERTPFGHGRPFSRRQIKHLLGDMMFTPERVESALIFPPFRSRMLLRSAPLWERFGGKFAPVLAGVTLTEARKQVYGALPAGAVAVSRRTALAAANPYRNPANRGATSPGQPVVTPDGDGSCPR